MLLSSSWLLLALAYVAFYFLVQVIYRLFFHQWSRYPGPNLTAATFLYEFYNDVIKVGQFLFQIEKMHERYGNVDCVLSATLSLTSARPNPHKRDRGPQWLHITSPPLSTISTVSHGHHRFHRSITALSPVIEERVLKLMQRFQQAYGTKSAIPVAAAFSALGADVITHYAYGKSWGFLEDPQYRNDIRKATNETANFVHWLRFFPFLVPVIRTNPTQIMCFIHPGKNRLSQSKHDESAGTIFSRQTTDPSLPPEERSLARVKDEALILLGAGIETTARILTIATVLPALSSTATWAELEKLPYLTAVINDSLRLSFGTTIRLPRIAPTEALKYKDYTIPPVTPVRMSTWSVHQDPCLFPDPRTFRPERWIEASD
ncbi:cytochrome P450 [Aspergillus novofumigatus IBT 16806]|uniref:Cytochrome P450 n=1 Tax=Aspergillus novofumigatus (strain IBT 16806) TaxID=1392255 RepID=A0A2I1BYP7_ASPN1|nr:cytochrome P450 [Aspergillus novofumigatus IBT 16806]PKX90471.1 cytochrome P450 [Aspergillus novofumigatus IBT 16806]